MCFPPTHSYTRDVLLKGDIASATKTDKKMINNAVTKQKYDQIYETIVWKGGGGGYLLTALTFEEMVHPKTIHSQ